MKILHSISISIILVTLAGCSAQRSLSSDFYKPQNPLDNKQEVTIGLFKNSNHKSSVISYSDGMFSCSVDTSDADTAIANELRSLYKTVRILRHPSECKECDAFVAYQFDFDIKRRAFDVVYDSEMTLAFYSKNKEFIQAITTNDSGTGSAVAASALTGLTLGLTAQITAEAYAAEMKSKVQKSLGKMISTIGQDIRYDYLLSDKSIKNWDKNVEEAKKEEERKLRRLDELKDESLRKFWKCVNKNVAELDDGISDVNSISSVVFDQCGSYFITGFRAVSTDLPEDVVQQKIRNIKNGDTGIIKKIGAQVLRNRNLQKRR